MICDRKVLVKLGIPGMVLNFDQNIPILRHLKSKPFATFKWPFATCDEWRMGWTTLVYTIYSVLKEFPFLLWTLNKQDKLFQNLTQQKKRMGKQKVATVLSRKTMRHYSFLKYTRRIFCKKRSILVISKCHLGVDFINILCLRFLYESALRSFF